MAPAKFESLSALAASRDSRNREAARSTSNVMIKAAPSLLLTKVTRERSPVFSARASASSRICTARRCWPIDW